MTRQEKIEIAEHEISILQQVIAGLKKPRRPKPRTILHGKIQVTPYFCGDVALFAIGVETPYEYIHFSSHEYKGRSGFDKEEIRELINELQNIIGEVE